MLHRYLIWTSFILIEIIDEQEEGRLQNHLKKFDRNTPWSVKNQARMHVLNDSPPYESSVDAISKFPETATSLGLKVDEDDRLILAAPHGLEDVFEMKVRPTPYFINNERSWIYEKRIVDKNWMSKWPYIEIIS